MKLKVKSVTNVYYSKKTNRFGYKIEFIGPDDVQYDLYLNKQKWFCDIEPGADILAPVNTEFYKDISGGSGKKFMITQAATFILLCAEAMKSNTMELKFTLKIWK